METEVMGTISTPKETGEVDKSLVPDKEMFTVVTVDRSCAFLVGGPKFGPPEEEFDGLDSLVTNTLEMFAATHYYCTAKAVRLEDKLRSFLEPIEYRSHKNGVLFRRVLRDIDVNIIMHDNLMEIKFKSNVKEEEL